MWDFEGKKYARVSDVIRPFVDFSHVPVEVLNRKAALGTRVHKAIEQEINGDMAVVGLGEQGYVQSFEQWRAEVEPVFVESERRYYCDEKMITGCIDALVEFKGTDKRILIDFKTSAQESPVTWPMQAHLYHYLASKHHNNLDSRILFLKLDRKGALPKVFIYNFDDNVIRQCMQAIDVFWEKEKGCDKCSE